MSEYSKDEIVCTKVGGFNEILYSDGATGSCSSKTRRPRTVFTDDQLQKLEEEFQADKCPDLTKHRDIAYDLKLTEEQVVGWFKNRRTKWKRRNGIAIQRRTVFTPEQLQKLQDEFHANKYLSVAQRRRIALDLNIFESQVARWFKGRRAKWKSSSSITLRPPSRGFTSEQRARLEDEFHTMKFPNIMQRLLIAYRLNLSQTQVAYWFKDRRKKIVKL